MPGGKTVELLLIFLCKSIDHFFAAFRTLSIAKDKFFLASVNAGASATVSTFAYVAVAKSGSPYAILVIAAAPLFGSYLSGMLYHKMEDHKPRIYEITSSNLEKGLDFCALLRQNDIATKMTRALNEKMEEVVYVKVYCNEKTENAFVKKNMPACFRYSTYFPVETSKE